MGDRYAAPRAILGEELFQKLQDSRVLVVGAGGIGCELLKNMVMTGFGGSQKGSIELLDLDTIDLSNLNRQFLFQKQHVKRPKAVVARETALKFNPNVKITALHRNIKDTDFNVDYFKSFDFVMNALDNLDARRHVNKMCLAASIPLIESGTSGYRGQVQPINGRNNTTDCFDCTGKPVPKTFAVCTIRSTPTTAHHCIAWAKSYLFPQLFGADDENDQSELDDAEKNGENVDEIQELRKEALAVRKLRETLSSSPEGASRRVFEKVYKKDLERLLQMTDMWTHRKPPHTLDFDQLEKELRESKKEKNGSNGVGKEEEVVDGGEKEKGEKGKMLIKDQRKLELVDSFELFISSVERLQKRIDPTGQNPLSFDKDDDDTLDFVVAAANLRAAAFEIESQTRFQVKEYAGNIIPAIATTNAIIAGAIVLQSLAHLRDEWTSARSVWLNRQSDKIFDVGPCSKPNPFCAVCRIVYVPVRVREDFTLKEFVELVVGGEEVGLGRDGGFVSCQEGSRLLWETEDFEDNGDKTLKELECGVGKFITVEDDEEPTKWPISFSVGSFLPSDSPNRFEIDTSSLPNPLPLKPIPPPAADSSDSKSNDNNDDDGDITFAMDDPDEIQIVEPTTSSEKEEKEVQMKDALAPQLSLKEGEGPLITGKKRSAQEAQLGEGEKEGGEGEKESPNKKEKKDQEEEVEVIDLT